MPEHAIPDPASCPFEVVGQDHVVLSARDYGKLVAFYRDAIRCRIAWERSDLGLTHLFAGRQMIDIVDLAGPLGAAGVASPSPLGRNVDHLCLQVRPFDFQTIAAHLRIFGIELAPPRERFGADGFAPSVYLVDPEGNGIEMKAAKD